MAGQREEVGQWNSQHAHCSELKVSVSSLKVKWISQSKGAWSFLLLFYLRGPSARQETPALRSCKVCSGLIFKVGWHGCCLIRTCTRHEHFDSSTAAVTLIVVAEGCGRAEPHLPCHMYCVLSTCLSSCIPYPSLPCSMTWEVYFYGHYHKSPLPSGFQLGLGNRRH